jgi:hypothetical protein
MAHNSVRGIESAVSGASVMVMCILADDRQTASFGTALFSPSNDERFVHRLLCSMTVALVMALFAPCTDLLGSLYPLEAHLFIAGTSFV